MVEYIEQEDAELKYNSSLIPLYTVWKVISPDWQCQNVPSSIPDMFVIDHKEKVSLINHKQFCD